MSVMWWVIVGVVAWIAVVAVGLRFMAGCAAADRVELAQHRGLCEGHDPDGVRSRT